MLPQPHHGPLTDGGDTWRKKGGKSQTTFPGKSHGGACMSEYRQRIKKVQGQTKPGPPKTNESYCMYIIKIIYVNLRLKRSNI